MHQLFHADCFDWLRRCPPRSLQAVCTDPPYGLLEFTEKEVGKLRAGRGGVWRLPPLIGGSRRDPLPRFTILSEEQKLLLRAFFKDWGRLLSPALVPGAHVCVAGHPILQYLVQDAMAQAGYEVRPAIMRLYFSFRGGDRPKNAEQEFPEVCVSPKGAYEPWMLFRKPIEKKTVAENLRRWGTGGLRRMSVDKPLPEAIPSGRTPDREEAISPHPCLKPQHFMRVIVRALLPLGKGTILDPFMGSGSTIAAAEAVGYDSMGVELDKDYFKLAQAAIPRLTALYPVCKGDSLECDINYAQTHVEPENQLSFGLAEQPAVYAAKKTRQQEKITTNGKNHRSKRTKFRAKANLDENQT
ncbi:MAG TPA: DNA methyltransferase [Candidatus Acidoferrales bacterium]|nr:DNA methyltransferase [Candidatus Acidoferrales bacterium]